MEKRLMKFSKIILVIVLSIIMISSIIYSIVGKKNYNYDIKFDSLIKINSIYINGLNSDINSFNPLIQNGNNYFKKIDIETSNLTDFCLNISCDKKEIKANYSNKVITLCQDKKQTEDYLYVKNNNTKIIEQNIISMSKMKKIFLILLLVFLIVFNIFTIKYTEQIIETIKNDKLTLKNICFLSVLYFITFLFTFNFIKMFINEYIFIVIAIVSVILLYKIRNKIRQSIQYAFLFISLICGLSYIFLIPPLNIPDEGQHFTKVYSSANFNNYSLEFNDYGKVFIKLPKSVNTFINKYSYNVLNYQTEYRPSTYLTDMFQVNNKRMSNSIRWYSLYSAKYTAYIPAILICSIMKMLNIPLIIIFYSCRFINLLIFILIAYYVIKNIPTFKKSILLVSLLPITLHQAIGINQDSLNNTLFLLLFYFIVKLIYDEKYYFSKQNMIVISLISILLSCCKTIYIAILIMMFAIPKNKYKKLKLNKFLEKYFCYIFVCAIMMISFIIYKYVGIKVPILKKEPADFYSIQNALHYPLNFINIILKTIKNRITLDLFRGLFDGYGWSIIWNPDIIRDLSMIIYTILIFAIQKSEKKLNKKTNIIMSTTSFVIFASIYYAMLFAWSRPEIDSIDGLQPRYFVPIVYILYIQISNLTFCNVKKNYINIILIYGSLLGLLLSIITITRGFM